MDSLFALVITGKPVPVSTSSTSEESTSTLVGVSVFASSSCMFVMSEKSEMFPTASTILVTMLYSLTPDVNKLELTVLPLTDGV